MRLSGYCAWTLEGSIFQQHWYHGIRGSNRKYLNWLPPLRLHTQWLGWIKGHAFISIPWLNHGSVRFIFCTFFKSFSSCSYFLSRGPRLKQWHPAARLLTGSKETILEGAVKVCNHKRRENMFTGYFLSFFFFICCPCKFKWQQAVRFQTRKVQTSWPSPTCLFTILEPEHQGISQFMLMIVGRRILKLQNCEKVDRETSALSIAVSLAGRSLLLIFRPVCLSVCLSNQNSLCSSCRGYVRHKPVVAAILVLLGAPSLPNADEEVAGAASQMVFPSCCCCGIWLAGKGKDTNFLFSTFPRSRRFQLWPNKRPPPPPIAVRHAFHFHNRWRNCFSAFFLSF